MSRFCNVISNSSSSAKKAAPPVTEDDFIDFECLQAINERIEKETQHMLETFERQQKAVNIRDNMLFINENNIGISFKDLCFYNDELKRLEEELAFEEHQLEALKRNCNEMEHLSQFNISEDSVATVRQRTQEIQHLQHLLLSTQIQIDRMHFMLHNIYDSQQDFGKKFETQKLLKDFMNYHDECVKKLNVLLDLVIFKMNSSLVGVRSLQDRKDEVAEETQRVCLKNHIAFH